MILWRPVYQRASLIAFSFASAPPFVKNDIVRAPGVTSASSFPRRERDSVAIGGPIVARGSAWSLIAWTIFGCEGPIETVTGCAAKTGGGVAPESQKDGPSVRSAPVGVI